MWPFTLALKQLFPPRRFPVFAFVSMLGVMCGVTALLVVQTVMNSFGEEHRKRNREAVGDVVIERSGKPLEDVAATVKGLEALPDVAAAAAYLEGGVILQVSENDLRFLGVRAIDVGREGAVTPMADYLYKDFSGEFKGDLDDLDDERVIMGWRLAWRLGIVPGSRITIQSPVRLAQAIEGEKVPLPKELEVCALIKTGFKDVDDNAMFVTLRTGRELFLLPPDTATKIHLKLKDHEQAEVFAGKLNSRLPRDIESYPWTEVNKFFLESVAMEKQMLFFLMFIITLVASFSIGSTLFSQVVRRTKEIGLFGALGARPTQILRLFLTQGVLIGIVGFALGVGMTFLILYFRQEIVELIGAEERLIKQYRFDSVPLHYNVYDFLNAGVLTVVLMTLASLLPALWAARRKPSEAMRDVG